MGLSCINFDMHPNNNGKTKVKMRKKEVKDVQKETDNSRNLKWHPNPSQYFWLASEASCSWVTCTNFMVTWKKIYTSYFWENQKAWAFHKDVEFMM